MGAAAVYPLQHFADPALIEAAPSGYALEGPVANRKHRSLQFLQLVHRQSHGTTAALGIAQASDAVVSVVANPIAQRLTIYPAGLRRLRARPSASTIARIRPETSSR